MLKASGLEFFRVFGLVVGFMMPQRRWHACRNQAGVWYHENIFLAHDAAHEERSDLFPTDRRYVQEYEKGPSSRTYQYDVDGGGQGDLA